MYPRHTVIVLLSLIFAGICRAADAPALAALLPPEELQTKLIPREEWRPFPMIDDRDFWEALPGDAKQELVAQGEAHLGASWAPLPATSFLEHYRTGSRELYMSISHERRRRLAQLVLAECVEDRGRFLDDIVNGIWTIAEESFWGNSPSTWTQASLEDQERYANQRLHLIRTSLPDVTNPGVDLFVAETAAAFALTDYLIGVRLDEITPILRQRMQVEVERRMLKPCLDRDFSWMFTHGNWNVWIGSNWLTCALLMEKDPSRRVAAVQKIMAQIDRYLEHALPDGACDEGPGYWRQSAATLFSSLELLYDATEGALDVFEDPLVRDLGAYIYRVHLGGRNFFNYNDGHAQLDMPTELMMRYGRRTGDPFLMALGAALPGGDALNGSGRLLRRLPALQDLASQRRTSASTQAPLLRDTWLPAMQVMTARTRAGSIDGLTLAAKGGHNGEAHNHNDAGTFVLYSDGRPAIIDIGQEAYTAQNSSPQRYEIWTMQSAWHNLPTIGGVMQAPGREHAAREVGYSADDTAVQFDMDLAGTYPPEASLTSWHRTLRMERGGIVTLNETYELTADVSEISLSLITAARVTQNHPGELSLDVGGQARPVVVHFDPAKLRAKLENVPLRDAGLQRMWGEQLIRILLIADKPARQDEWTITFSQGAQTAGAIRGGL